MTEKSDIELHQDMGYVQRAIEELTAEIRDQTKKEEEEIKLIEKRISAIELELGIKKRALQYIIGGLSIVVALLSFQLGDVKKLFAAFFLHG